MKLRRLAREPASGFTFVESSPESAELRSVDSTLVDTDAHVIEDARLTRHNVGTATDSGFTAFLDGLQRSDVKLYHDAVPIVYAYAAAVVRTRNARKFSTHPAANAGSRYHVEREGLFFPFRYVPARALADAGLPWDVAVDTNPEDEEALPLFPPHILLRAARRIASWREKLEAGLAIRWSREQKGFLLVDGTLTTSTELARCTRAVGVLKNHRTRFFDGEEAALVLSLQAGERTSVFQPSSRQFAPVYSWYLRLREAAGRGAMFGLVRVEVAAEAGSVSRADEISQWIIAESAPVPLPDPGWDRLLYPIYDCEQFLRSRAPSL